MQKPETHTTFGSLTKVKGWPRENFKQKKNTKDQVFLRAFPTCLATGGGEGEGLSQETLHRYFQFKKKGKWAHPVSLTVDYLCLFLHGANSSSQMTIHLQVINKGQCGFRLFLWLKVAKKNFQLFCKECIHVYTAVFQDKFSNAFNN